MTDSLYDKAARIANDIECTCEMIETIQKRIKEKDEQIKNLEIERERMQKKLEGEKAELKGYRQALSETLNQAERGS